MYHYGPFYTLGVGALLGTHLRSALLRFLWLGGCVRLSSLITEMFLSWHRSHYVSVHMTIELARVRRKKNMMEIPSGGALIFPLGNVSEFNWIKIILPVMFFDIVHILNLGSICNEALHCFSRMGEGIHKDSLHQVWQHATALARVFVFVSSGMGHITSRGSLLGQFTAVLSQAIYLRHLNTHIKL